MSSVPQFLHKLFPDDSVLAQLYSLREAIQQEIDVDQPKLQEFLTLALIRAAYDATHSKIDGVYIAPTTLKKTVSPAFIAFQTRVNAMLADLEWVLARCQNAPATII